MHPQRFVSRAWTFVAARFARGEYLGLHLTIGFAISLAGLWLFGGITEDVIHHDPLTQFDVTLLEWLHARATPTGYAIAKGLSFLGSPWVLTVGALAVGLLLAARRQWIVLGGWVAALAGGGILEAVLKSVIRRPRRWNSGVPSSVSRRPIWSEREGCEIYNSSAARLKCSRRAAVTK